MTLAAAGRAPIARLTRAFAPAGAILAYHGVSSPSEPSASIAHVDRDQLLRDIDAFRAELDIVPLRTLLARHDAGESTAGQVALTFDDAYASLVPLRDAVRERRLPITLFATTGFAGAPFWWDRIDDLHPRVSPARWRDFEMEIGLDESYRVGQPLAHGPLRPLRQWLLASSRGRWLERHDFALARLEAEVGFRTAQRPMTSPELMAFARDPLVDVGVHTRSHPVLPLLDPADLWQEIEGGYRDLRGLVPKAIPCLAAPYGLFDERSAELAQAAGMEHVLGLGDRTLAAPFAAGVLPRISMSRSVPAWKVQVRLTGFPERLKRIMRFTAPNAPLLPSPTS